MPSPEIWDLWARACIRFLHERRSTRINYEMKVPASLVITSLLAGCDLADIGGIHTACTMEARPGIVVHVSKESGENPPHGSARAVAIEGAYSDTSWVHFDGRAYLVEERAGVYEVIVEQSGYRTWRRSGIRVEQGECHVKTVTLEVLMRGARHETG